MKKNNWILILLIILMAIPSHAGKLVVEEDRDRLRFEDIENLMIEKNPIIQINKNTKRNLRDAKDAIKEAEDSKRDIEDAIDGLEDAIDGMRKAIDAQDEMIGGLTEMSEIGSDLDIGGLLPDDDSSINPEEIPGFEEISGIYQGVTGIYQGMIGSQIGTLEFVKVLYEGNIASLEQNIEALENQLKELEKLPAQELELDKAILQINMGNEGIIWGAKNLYLAYGNLEKQRNELIRNLELLEKQIDIMKLQKNLGMITELDLIGTINQRDQMTLGIKTLETQMDNLKRELNGTLGQELDKEIELEDEFTLDEEAISKINYEDDLKTAKKNSYSVQIKEYDYNIQNINTKWEERHCSSDDRIAAKRNLENADAELDEEVKNVELTFNKAYQELQNKVLTYDTEKKNLEYERQKDDILKLKYELGVISKMDLEQGKSEYYANSNKAIIARQDLFQNLLQYEELLKGMNYIQ